MRSEQVLTYIEGYIADKGYSPTVREIGTALGISSPATVHGHISRLERRGLVSHIPGSPRTLRLTNGAT